jgi:predicted RNase H-like nuclease
VLRVRGDARKYDEYSGSVSKSTIAGVDGCKDGWVVVSCCNGEFAAWISSTFGAVLSRLPASAIVAVDIPIGLTESGGRACDVQARRLLGPGRGSSVFPAPVRGVLGARPYATASERHRAIDNRGLSRQAFAIMPKIEEVDALLRRSPSLVDRVFEVHPEVSFARWNNGHPMLYPKSSDAGRQEREALVDQVWPGHRETLWNSLAGNVTRDDLNDAFAALWSARRIADSCAVSLPEAWSRDERGLPMRITA